MLFEALSSLFWLAASLKTLYLHTGQRPFIFSHFLRHSAWKWCLAGKLCKRTLEQKIYIGLHFNWQILSSGLYSTIHMLHSLLPGRHSLKANTGSLFMSFYILISYWILRDGKLRLWQEFYFLRQRNRPRAWQKANKGKFQQQRWRAFQYKCIQRWCKKEWDFWLMYQLVLLEWIFKQGKLLSAHVGG